MGSLQFESRNLEVTEDFLTRAYAPMRIGSSVEDFSARVDRNAAGSISVDRLEIGFDMAYDVEPLGKVSLCVVESGSIRDQTTDGWKDDFVPGDVVAFAPHDRPYSGRVVHSRYSITMFDPALLAKVSGATAPVRLLEHRPRTPAAGAQLAETIRYLGNDLLVNPTIQTSRLLLTSAEHLLASSVLAAFPNTALDGDGRNVVHPQTIQRAISFMEENVDQEISIGDIALAAGVTVRAVQSAFQRGLDISPLGYLRRLRMIEARAELLAADPARTKVTTIAARWGFHHLGRFATAYREAYGETPSETLRR